jgi:hypothetical protein
MNNSEAYRATAEDCAELAATVEDRHVKLILLNMAEAWLRLAAYVEQRDRNGDCEPLEANGSPDHEITPK